MALQTGIEAADAICSPNAHAAILNYARRTEARFRDYLAGSTVFLLTRASLGRLSFLASQTEHPGQRGRLG